MKITWKTKLRRFWIQSARPIIIMAIVVFAFRSAIADWNDVPTGSMKPTILEGDRVFVNKLAFDLKVPFTTIHLAEWSNPQRGDIVVFFSPLDGKRLVKRVVGLPGDRIEMADNRVTVNGEPVNYEPLDEARAAGIPEDLKKVNQFATETLGQHQHTVMAMPYVSAKRTIEPVTVPAGQYFMMGDNRDNSFDSRYFGCVPRERIVGRTSSVVLSVDPEHHYRPRWQRFFTGLP